MVANNITFGVQSTKMARLWMCFFKNDVIVLLQSDFLKDY